MRTVFVAPGRLERWVVKFGERHPGVRAQLYRDRAELSAPDSAAAVLYPPFGSLPGSQAGTDANPEDVAVALAARAQSVEVIRVLLLRRGGYACAVLTGDALSAAKVASRQRSGQQRSGQQHSARRRDGQVQALLNPVVDVAARILLPVNAGDVLVTGGDRALVEQALSDPRLTPLTGIRLGRHLEIGDPTSELVKKLPDLARAIRITLEED